MKIIDLIRELRASEIAQIPNYKESTNSDTAKREKENVKAYTNIIGLINAGMRELHYRFPLIENEFIVDLQEAKTEYQLPDDFLRATVAYEENGYEIPINTDPDDPAAIFFPTWDKVQVPTVKNDTYISIVYVAGPDIIELGDKDSNGNYPNLEQKLKLPHALIEPLKIFVGYKAYEGMAGMDDRLILGRLQKFEDRCEKARLDGSVLTTDSFEMSDRIYERGFV